MFNVNKQFASFTFLLFLQYSFQMCTTAVLLLPRHILLICVWALFYYHKMSIWQWIEFILWQLWNVNQNVIWNRNLVHHQGIDGDKFFLFFCNDSQLIRQFNMAGDMFQLKLKIKKKYVTNTPSKKKMRIKCIAKNLNSVKVIDDFGEQAVSLCSLLGNGWPNIQCGFREFLL